MDDRQIPNLPPPPPPPEWPVDGAQQQPPRQLPSTPALQPPEPQQMTPSQDTKTNPGAEQVHPRYQTPNYGEKEHGYVDNQAGVPDEFMHMFEHDPNEVIIHQATRHPIGVFIIYLLCALGIIGVIMGYMFFLSDSAILSGFGISSASAGAIASIVAIVAIVLVGLIGYAMAYVYKKSRFILTNQKVVIIHYHSLISREVSQLNIANVEDVNVSQPNILDRLFKTGKITIETAGEQNRYILSQIDNPHEFARLTIQAHEGAIAEYGN